ncbi:hypothetical protein DFH11DRAFT_1723061 [Phellopilus nigrolimitatus]|nr:hypothetical protein DFH11DRAFT_1723061 [Phellopilus nigrolimitatus]
MGWKGEGPWTYRLLHEPHLTDEFDRQMAPAAHPLGSGGTAERQAYSATTRPCPDPEQREQDRHVVASRALDFRGHFDGHAGHDTVDYTLVTLPSSLDASLTTNLLTALGAADASDGPAHDGRVSAKADRVRRARPGGVEAEAVFRPRMRGAISVPRSAHPGSPWMRFPPALPRSAEPCPTSLAAAPGDHLFMLPIPRSTSCTSSQAPRRASGSRRPVRTPSQTWDAAVRERRVGRAGHRCWWMQVRTTSWRRCCSMRSAGTTPGWCRAG